MKVEVQVKPNSKKTEVIEKETLTVHLKSPAREGKANRELIKILSKYFGKQVRIIAGKTSKKKLVEVY